MIQELTDTYEFKERRVAQQINNEFESQILESDVSLYAITLSTNESYVKNQNIWFDKEARSTLCEYLFKSFIHRVSSKICSNYKRNKYASQRIQSWGVFEHLSKETNELCIPHIHATLAIHSSWEDKFLSLFDYSATQNHWTINEECKVKCLSTLNPVITSIHLMKIDDAVGWGSYCLKNTINEESKQNQIQSEVFTHNGLSIRKRD